MIRLDSHYMCELRKLAPRLVSCRVVSCRAQAAVDSRSYIHIIVAPPLDLVFLLPLLRILKIPATTTSLAIDALIRSLHTEP